MEKCHPVSYHLSGDVVTTSDRDAGEYASVYFNSQLAAYSEIFVVDDVFAVRIVKTAWRTSPVPYPGETDELAEILDTEIQLASISASLHQMKGAGPYTVVNLGKKHTPRDNAELLVAGIPAALGTVCFIGRGFPLAPETVEKLKTQAEISEIAPLFRSLVIFYNGESELADWLRSHNVKDTVLPLLRNARKQRISMKPLVGESADEEEVRKLIPGNEMTLLVGLGSGDDGANSFSIVHPYIYLQKVLNRLS